MNYTRSRQSMPKEYKVPQSLNKIQTFDPFQSMDQIKSQSNQLLFETPSYLQSPQSSNQFMIQQLGQNSTGNTIFNSNNKPTSTMNRDSSKKEISTVTFTLGQEQVVEEPFSEQKKRKSHRNSSKKRQQSTSNEADFYLNNNNIDIFTSFQGKFQDLMKTIEDEEKKREDLEQKNLEMRNKLFNSTKDQRSTGSQQQHQQQHTYPDHYATESQPLSSNRSSLMLEEGYKDKIISQMSIENRKLKEELTQVHYQKFQLEQDLEYLKKTLESHLPFFNELELKNQQLTLELSQKHKDIKSFGRSSMKVRKVETELQQQQKQFEKEKWRMTEETKSLKERLDVLRKMNQHLQKLMGYHRRKAEYADGLIKRCVELEKANQKLINIVYLERQQNDTQSQQQQQQHQNSPLIGGGCNNFDIIKNYSRPETQSPQLISLLGLQETTKQRSTAIPDYVQKYFEEFGSEPERMQQEKLKMKTSFTGKDQQYLAMEADLMKSVDAKDEDQLFYDLLK